MRKPWTARNKMMDFLARRDHSEKELRQKLKRREFPEAEIDKAIDWAKERKWLKASDQVSQIMAEAWHRKNKGIHYINHQLRLKGLPALSEDQDRELEKAKHSLSIKKLNSDLKDPKIRAKHVRFLTSRGFSLETIGRTLKSMKN